ncbi:MAG TPA: glycosyltransferase [Planctomycetota bacterium]|nr:glycosyltransferase [Planctomycetota bacterium]
MDVLHVIHQFPPESRGGSESYVFDLAQRQRERGADVQVLSGSKQWREQVVLESGEVDGLPVHRLHRDDLFFDHHAKMWHPVVEQKFAELLQKWRPALVHVHHWVRLSCNLVDVCWQQRVPAVVTLHDYYTSCPRAFRRRPGDEACQRVLSVASCGDCVPRYGHEQPAEIAAGIELFADHFRAELSLARAVLVGVASTADLLSHTTGVPRDRYEVLPLGYKARFTGMPPLAAPAPGEPWRFAFWGGAGRHKGVDVLVRAFRRLHAARPGRAELHVLGDAESDEFGGELRALAKGLPVTFHGAFVAAQLHAAHPHVGVFPSTCLETFGLVLDECFELALPCITSDLGALPERAGAAGLVTRAGDEADLAAALQRFVDEPGLWSQLRSLLPPKSPDLAAHAEALDAVYERARTEPPRDWFAGPVPASRRVWFLMKQRESALGKLVPPGGPK